MSEYTDWQIKFRNLTDKVIAMSAEADRTVKPQERTAILRERDLFAHELAKMCVNIPPV